MKQVSLLLDLGDGKFAFEVKDPDGETDTKLIWADSSAEIQYVKRRPFWVPVDEAGTQSVHEMELRWHRNDRYRPLWLQQMDETILSPVKWHMEQEQYGLDLDWEPRKRIKLYGPLMFRKSYLLGAVPYDCRDVGSGALVNILFRRKERWVISFHNHVHEAAEFVPKVMEIAAKATDDPRMRR